MEEKISLLIPVYNSGEFIEKCLTSIINQTYKNIEVIIIDDGSEDNSLKICKEIVKDDKRFKVYTRENKGIAYTRNELISKCTSNYFIFIDSDDFIDEKYVETLYKILKDYNTDIAICDLIFYRDNKIVNKKKEKNIEEKVFEHNEALKKLLYQYEIKHGVTGKLFKSELFENIKFPDGELYEDLATIYKVIDKCEKVVTTNYKGYYYVYNENSITKSKFKDKELFMLDCGEVIFDYVNKKYGDEFSLPAKNLLVTQAIQLAIKIPLKKEYDEYIKKIKKYIKMYRKDLLKDKETYLSLKVFLISSYFGLRSIKFTKSMIELTKIIR